MSPVSTMIFITIIIVYAIDLCEITILFLIYPFKHLENINVILEQPQVEEVKDFEIIKNPSFNNYYEF